LDRKKRFYLSARADWTEKNVFIPPREPIGRKKTFFSLRASRLDRKKRFYSSARADWTEKNVFIPPRGLIGQKKTFLSLRAGGVGIF